MRHLTDQEIQNYLDKKVTDASMETHVQSCLQCRNQIAVYEQIFSGLKKQNDIVLTANFAEKIIRILEVKEEKHARRWDWFFMGILGLLGVGLTIYYSNVSDVADSAKNLVEIDDSLKESANDWIGRLGGLLSGNFQFIVFGVLILLIIDWLDKKVVRKLIRQP